MNLRTCLALAALLVASPLSAVDIPPSWIQPVEPVRIVGNIHYVGTAELGAYLLIGSEGAVLLDAPLEQNAPLILANIEKLGVEPASVRVLLNSHAHFDHAGGLATVQEATGARLYLSAADAELAARGGREDFAFGDSVPYTPLNADVIVRDGDTVRLGDIALTAILTPGHTKGCTTWRTTVIEEDKPLEVVFLCSVTAPGYALVGNEKYPEILDDYRATFERLRTLRPDVFLANHGSFFNLTKKLAAPRDANPFVVPGELSSYLERAWNDLERAAQKQSASAVSARQGQKRE